MQQRVCNFYQKEIAAALTVHINVLLVLEFQNRNHFLICKGKSPEVPFHGITSSYSYFEVILIFAPIQQEAKYDQEKISAEQR